MLMHSNTPYDPAKAHEYYEKHKHLHPRAPGHATYTVKSKTGRTYRVTAEQLAEQKNYAAHRVAQIKKNLSDLAVLLRDKMEKAKEAEKKAAKPPTLAEKAQAAREAKKYRDSHKQEISNKAKRADSKSGGGSSATKKSAGKTDTVESLKADITKTKASLKDAVAKQRELATAKKNG